MASSAVELQLKDQDDMLAELKRHLERTQQRMMARADGHRRDVHFEVNDMVFLKLRPYRRRTLASRPFEKLAPRYLVLWPISCTFLIRLSSIRFFHVSQLKLALLASVPASPLPP